MNEVIFNAGQKVVAIGGYNWLLTEGKQYDVIHYESAVRDEAFQWPAYVTVISDNGKPVTGHAHRFRALTNDE